MNKVNKRERVLVAMSFEEVDRTPVYDLLCNDHIIEHFTGEIAPPDKDADMLDIISAKTKTAADARNHAGLKAVCHTIASFMDMTRSIHAPAEPGMTIDEDGFVTAKNRWTRWIEQRPFSADGGHR